MNFADLGLWNKEWNEEKIKGKKTWEKEEEEEKWDILVGCVAVGMGGCVVRESLSLVLIKQNTVSLEKDDIFTTLKKKNAYTYQT